MRTEGDQDSGTAISGNEKFALPDGLRGLAALWVVLYHVHVSGRVDPALDQLPGPIRSIAFDNGALGVAVFFVLSGFVIAHSLRRSFEQPPDLKVFATRRLLRLTPPYYGAMAVALAFAALASRMDGAPFGVGGDTGDVPLTVPRFISHLFYSQELLGFDNLNDVFWTLCIEVQFYAVFAALMWLVAHLAKRTSPQRALAAIFGPTATLSLLWPLGLVAQTGRAVAFYPLWHLFVLGALTYWAWVRRISPLVLGVFAMVLAIGLQTGHDPTVTVAGLATAAILFVAAETNRLGSWLSGKLSQYLGRISYSLYLVHTPVLGAALTLSSTAGPASPVVAWLGLAVGVLASLVAATLFQVVVEEPSIQVSRSVRPSGRSPVDSATRPAGPGPFNRFGSTDVSGDDRPALS